MTKPSNELLLHIEAIIAEIVAIAEQNKILDLTLVADRAILDRNLDRVDQLEVELIGIRKSVKTKKLRVVK
jgi:hypothetical protein